MAATPATRRRALRTITCAAALGATPVAIRLAGVHPEPVVAAVLFGLGVVGASFMLAWAAEAVQLDISAGLALALLALVAVLPEYAVDLVFTWKAGKHPAKFAPDALANMTGGNQLLIGIGWSLVVLLGAYRLRRRRRFAPRDVPESGVVLSRKRSIEIAFLAIATVYGLTLPLRRTLTLLDALVLVTLFGLYVARVARAPAETPHLVGPALAIGELTPARRRAAVTLLFGGAIVTILACAEPFAESLVDTGRQFDIDDFLLISLVAPLASEAPELLVAGMFAWRLDADTGLGALVSSKVNQWTLLVGTLPIVFAVSSASTHGLPIDAVQREELFVTAAQSAYALAVLANRRISVGEATTMLGLFGVQVATKLTPFDAIHAPARIGVGVAYLALALVVVVRNRAAVQPLLRDGLRASHASLAEADLSA